MKSEQRIIILKEKNPIKDLIGKKKQTKTKRTLNLSEEVFTLINQLKLLLTPLEKLIIFLFIFVIFLQLFTYKSISLLEKKYPKKNITSFLSYLKENSTLIFNLSK